MAAALERLHFPKTGHKGAIRTICSAKFVLVSFDQQRIHVLPNSKLSSPITIINHNKRIEQFEVVRNGPKRYEVWLLSDRKLYVAILDECGVPIATKEALTSDVSCRSSKKRLHQDIAADSSVKLGSKKNKAAEQENADILHSSASKAHIVSPTMPIDDLDANFFSIFPTCFGIVGQLSHDYTPKIISSDGSATNFGTIRHWKGGKVVSTLALSTDEASDSQNLGNLKVVSSAFSSAVFGVNSIPIESPYTIVATSLGEINAFDDLRTKASKLITSLNPRRIESRMILMDIINIPETLEALILVFGDGRISVTSVIDKTAKTQHFSLSRPITSACIIKHSIYFTSEGCIYSTDILRNPSSHKGVVITSIKPNFHSPRALSVSRLFTSRKLVVLESGNTLLVWNTESEVYDPSSKDAKQKISTSLQLLTQNLEHQEQLQNEESQVNDLIQRVNSAIHIGGRKNSFNVVMKLKSELGLFPTLAIALVPPNYLSSSSKSHWYLSINTKQGDTCNSWSIPFEKLIETSTSSVLSYRLKIPLKSLEPLNVTAYAHFGLGSILSKAKKSRETNNVINLRPEGEYEVASFLLGEFTFDAIDMLVKDKRDIAKKDDTSCRSFFQRLRLLILAGNKSAPTQTITFPIDMVLNFSRWTFPDWSVWNKISEEQIAPFFGALVRSSNTSKAQQASLFSSKDAITAYLSSTGDARGVSLMLRPKDPSSPSELCSTLVAALHCSSNLDFAAVSQTRSSIMSRVASKSDKKVKFEAEQILAAKSLSKEMNSKFWPEILHIFTLFAEVESKWRQFEEYKRWSDKKRSENLDPIFAACNDSYEDQNYSTMSSSVVESQSRPTLPSLLQTNEEAQVIFEKLLALYIELRQKVGLKYAL